MQRYTSTGLQYSDKQHIAVGPTFDFDFTVVATSCTPSFIAGNTIQWRLAIHVCCSRLHLISACKALTGPRITTMTHDGAQGGRLDVTT